MAYIFGGTISKKIFINQMEKKFMRSYNRYSDLIFRYCYYRVFELDNAKDFVQEVYCRAWKYIIDGNNVENMKVFLYSQANNIVVDELRKKPGFFLNQIIKKFFLPNIDSAIKNENYLVSQEVLNIVKSLDKKYRNIIILKYIEGLSAKEISLILNETEDVVRLKINRGFEKLKEIFIKFKTSSSKIISIPS